MVFFGPECCAGVMCVIRVCVVPEMEVAGEVKRAAILFFRTMLQDLRGCLRLLDSMEFVSLLLYEHKHSVDFLQEDLSPQEVEANVTLIHDILKGVILFSQQDKDPFRDLEEWERWKFVSLGVIFSMQIITVKPSASRCKHLPLVSSSPTPDKRTHLTS